MYEGTLIWHEDSIAVQHFLHGELIFTKLKVGQEILLYQNGYWHKVKIHSTTEEPYIENWLYGDCLGCEVKLPDTQI